VGDVIQAVVYTTHSVTQVSGVQQERQSLHLSLAPMRQVATLLPPLRYINSLVARLVATGIGMGLDTHRDTDTIKNNKRMREDNDYTYASPLLAVPGLAGARCFTRRCASGIGVSAADHGGRQAEKAFTEAQAGSQLQTEREECDGLAMQQLERGWGLVCMGGEGAVAAAGQQTQQGAGKLGPAAQQLLDAVDDLADGFEGLFAQHGELRPAAGGVPLWLKRQTEAALAADSQDAKDRLQRPYHHTVVTNTMQLIDLSASMQQPDAASRHSVLMLAARVAGIDILWRLARNEFAGVPNAELWLPGPAVVANKWVLPSPASAC
jgi:hypothetical protein